MSQSIALGSPGAPSAAKPLLRGYLHLGAAALTIFATGLLLLLARGDPTKQASLLVYGPAPSCSLA